MLDRRQALGALTLGGAGLASGTDAAITSPFANGRREMTSAFPGKGEMILQQPPMDAAKWAGIVRKMREVYGAPVPAGRDASLAVALAGIRPASGAGGSAPSN